MYLEGIPCGKAVQYANGKHELGRLDGNRKIANGLTSYSATTFGPKILHVFPIKCFQKRKHVFLSFFDTYIYKYTDIHII